MEQLIKQIIDWGNSKGINNPESQFNKLAEEMLEAHEAYVGRAMLLNTGTYKAFVDEDGHLLEELGDIGVVWLLLCNMLDVNPYEALTAAHEKNKDRQGKTINGNFIKQEDL